jgi:hypothetical protein
MKKSFALILLIGTIGLMAFSPVRQGVAAVATATPTQTPTAFEVPAELPDGMEFWCLPEGVPYSKDAATVEKGDLAVDVAYDENGFLLEGPFGGCFVQLPNESQYKNAVIAFFDNSNSGAFYKRNLFENGDGLLAIVKHSYIIDAPLWQTVYRMAIVAEDGTELFSAPLNYQRKWQADRCWNGNMPNPVTMRCPLQLDLHPWDAGYGKPLPTVKPKAE